MSYQIPIANTLHDSVELLELKSVADVSVTLPGAYPHPITPDGFSEVSMGITIQHDAVNAILKFTVTLPATAEGVVIT
jgi:hypothetical protein